MNTDTKLNREVVGNIRKGMTLRGYDLKNLAVDSGISERTLRRRMQDPETFTVGELTRICRKLRIVMNFGGRENV